MTNAPPNQYPSFDWEIEQIESGGITPELLKGILTKHKKKAEHMKKLYGRYRSDEDAVPIFDRDALFNGQINNRLHNDYFSEIVDTKVGYFAGRSATYSYATDSDTDGEAQASGTDAEALSDAVTDFVTRCNMADLDAETTKLAAICGYAGHLLYIDKDACENVMLIDPWECVVLSRTRQMHEPDFALRYYEIASDKETRLRVEFYDATERVVFEGRSASDIVETGREAHLFDLCPLFGIANNNELMGDAEKVLSLIDAYDRTVSDVNNEIEAFRNAYMYVRGARIDDTAMQQAQHNGAFFLPNQDAEIGFITKTIDDAAIEHHLDRLEAGIYRFAMSPNLADEAFGGTTSGVAMKFKLFAMESKCAVFERKRTAAAMYMFKALATAWRKRQVTLDPLEVVIQYKRNFPLDLLSEAQSSGQLKGLVSEKTRLSLLSFIDDVEYEMRLMDDERDGIPALEAALPGEGVSDDGPEQPAPDSIHDGASQDIGASHGRSGRADTKAV